MKNTDQPFIVIITLIAAMSIFWLYSANSKQWRIDSNATPEAIQIAVRECPEIAQNILDINDHVVTVGNLDDWLASCRQAARNAVRAIDDAQLLAAQKAAVVTSKQVEKE